MVSVESVSQVLPYPYTGAYAIHTTITTDGWFSILPTVPLLPPFDPRVSPIQATDLQHYHSYWPAWPRLLLFYFNLPAPRGPRGQDKGAAGRRLIHGVSSGVLLTVYDITFVYTAPDSTSWPILYGICNLSETA